MLRLLGFIFTLMLSSPLLAQSSETREALSQLYRDYKADNFSILQGPPVTHLVPNFNTITYALSFDRQDVTVRLPQSSTISYADGDEYLKFSGHTIAPHLAVSLKKVGIGISILNLKRQSEYYSLYSYNSGRPYRQQSVATGSGVGLNLSFLPFEKLRKEYKLSVIAGGKSINIKHKYSRMTGNSSQDTGQLTDADYFTTSYTLLTYEAGLNFTMQLMKNFSAVPWIDYSHSTTGSADTNVKKTSEYDTTYESYQEDLQNFWHSDPRMRYGIDLSLRIMNFEARLGSALGALAKLGAAPEYIEDSTFTLTLSFDQSGG